MLKRKLRDLLYQRSESCSQADKELIEKIRLRLPSIAKVENKTRVERFKKIAKTQKAAMERKREHEQSKGDQRDDSLIKKIDMLSPAMEVLDQFEIPKSDQVNQISQKEYKPQLTDYDVQSQFQQLYRNENWILRLMRKK